tara:strand:- start:627 stop:770 length:144 start_codon:yes stop_codon:yes gene_type:complete
MAKAKTSLTSTFRPKSRTTRKGIHAKTKETNQKASRNYKKPYRGQGK